MQHSFVAFFVRAAIPAIVVSSSYVFIMDAIRALNFAGAILAIVNCSSELASSSSTSSLDDKEVHSVLETLRTRRLTLSTLTGFVEEQLSAGASQPSSDARELNGLAISCLEDSESLLKKVESKIQDFSGRERFQIRTDGEKLLSRAVTVQVCSIIKSASWLIDICELANTNIRC